MAAAAIVIRRNAQRQSRPHVEEEVVDTRPKYLRIFPSESVMSKDLKLGVLFGRYWFGRLLSYYLSPLPQR